MLLGYVSGLWDWHTLTPANKSNVNDNLSGIKLEVTRKE
jgi:hypothetical protein